MEEKAMTQEEKELFEKFKEYMHDHLIIEVEGEYDPYSGQSEHYHRVTFYFK